MISFVSSRWTLAREGARFYKRNRLLFVGGALILAVGMGMAALAANTLWSLSRPRVEGVRRGAYATFGQQSPGAPLQPISWRTIKQLEVEIPDTSLGSYGLVGSITATSNRQTFVIRVAVSSASLFERFAEPLAAGTSFSAEEEESGAGEPPMILSFRLAKELYGSPSAAIGESIRANGVSFRVKGVASQAFKGLFQAGDDAWVPPPFVVLKFAAPEMLLGQAWRSTTGLFGLAATKALSNDQAATMVTGSLRNAKSGRILVAASGFNTDPVRTALLRTWAGLAELIAMVLVVASGLTFGGVLLARAPRQLDEVRLKRTLGATATRLCLELVIGPAWVLVFGLLGALILAGIAVETTRHRLEGIMPPMAFSVTNVIFALLGHLPLVAGITLAAALVPALRLLRDRGAPRLSYGGSQTKQSTRLLEGIVTAEMFCCICASVVAAMVALTVWSLGKQSLGFQSQNQIVLALAPKPGSAFSYLTNPRGQTPLQLALYRVSQRLSAIPGVIGVALAQVAPLDPSANSIQLSEPGARADRRQSVNFNGVSANYFAVLGTRLTAGHHLTGELTSGNPTEAIVNETLGRQLWPNVSPIGRVLHLESAFGAKFSVAVVGVSVDQRIGGPKESVAPTVFLPLGGNVFQVPPLRILISGRATERRLEAIVNEELASAFPSLTVSRSYLIEDRLRGLLVDEQRRVLLAATGAAAIGTVAFIGLYSSLIYFIMSRRRELAIRVCCGATRVNIFWIVMGKAIRSGMTAAVLSIACWMPLRHLALSQWIGAASWSSAIAIAVTLLCLGTIGVVAAVPAFQASRMTPIEGLRDGV